MPRKKKTNFLKKGQTKRMNIKKKGFKVVYTHSEKKIRNKNYTRVISISLFLIRDLGLKFLDMESPLL